MDREQLLKNLQELENQLRGVKSATEQVNAVVRADKELISSVNAYTQKAQEFIAAIREQYTIGVADVKDAAAKSFKASSDEFARTVSFTQEKFVAQVKGFEDVIDKSLKPLINSELKPLPENISKAADACLKEMKGIEDSLKKTSEEVRDSIKSASDGYIKEMGKVNDQFSKKLEAVSSNVTDACLKEMKGTEDAVKKTLIEARDSIKAASDGHIKAMGQLENQITKKLEAVSTKTDELNDFMRTVPDQVKVVIGASVQEFDKIVEGQNSQIDRLRKQNLILTIIVIMGIIVMAVIKFA